jgi:hypothetical protein
VNALVTLWLKRGTPGQPLNIQWPFLLGIVMAALGGFLVTLYRP